MTTYFLTVYYVLYISIPFCLYYALVKSGVSLKPVCSVHVGYNMFCLKIVRQSDENHDEPVIERVVFPL